MALTREQKNKLGQCLARLVPGFDGQVLAYKDHEIVWRDARPQPTEQEIIAEYDKIIAEETSRQTKLDSALARIKATDIANANSIIALREIVNDMAIILGVK